MEKKLIGALYEGDRENVIIIDSIPYTPPVRKVDTYDNEPVAAEIDHDNYTRQFNRKSIPHYFEAPPPYKRKQLRSKGKAQKLARRKNRG